MTAGRVFRTSPPRGEGKRTHHTSPLVIRRVGHQPFGPGERLGLTLPVGCHLRIGRLELFEGRYCESCPAFALARIHDALERPDSAVLYSEAYQARREYFGGEDYWLAFRLAPTLERLGQLYEARGDTALALERYAEFVDQWGPADAELQPRVEAARAAIARLEGAR